MKTLKAKTKVCIDLLNLRNRPYERLLSLESDASKQKIRNQKLIAKIIIKTDLCAT
jgi:hypothetical protein